jgi:hypothetical protein
VFPPLALVALLPAGQGDVVLLIRNGSLAGRSAVDLLDARVYGMPIPDYAYP